MSAVSIAVAAAALVPRIRRFVGRDADATGKCSVAVPGVEPRNALLPDGNVPDARDEESAEQQVEREHRQSDEERAGGE